MTEREKCNVGILDASVDYGQLWWRFSTGNSVQSERLITQVLLAEISFAGLSLLPCGGNRTLSGHCGRLSELLTIVMYLKIAVFVKPGPSYTFSSDLAFP